MSFFYKLFGGMSKVNKVTPADPAILRKYYDTEETRSWTVLQDCDQKTAYKKFPDYDVAYIRAAGPIESSGIPGTWNNELLLEGLNKCKFKSRLLFHLSANNIFQNNGLEAFIQSIQAFNAITNLPAGAGPHVYVYYYLYYIFDHIQSPVNTISVCKLIAMNSIGVEISSSENSQIKKVAENSCRQINQEVIDEAEKIMRSKIKERKQEYDFPSFY